MVRKVSCLLCRLWENKHLHFEEVKCKDKGPMFVLLWKPRTKNVLCFVPFQITEKNISKLETKKLKTTVALQVFLMLFLSLYLSLIYYDFPCMQSNI